MNLLEQYLENYENLQEMRADLLESPVISQETIEYIFEKTDFSKQHWEGLNDIGKMRELQMLESNLAELEGRGVKDIELTDPSFFEKVMTKLTGAMRQGYYDPTTQKIYINKQLLNSPEDIKKVVNTVAHEGIHAYQDACIRGEAKHYNDAEVEEWRENWKPGNYLNANIYGYELYRNQPLEAFAFDRGDAISNSRQYA